jgi:uncharacterized protein
MAGIVDITPPPPQGHNIIEGYGQGGFRISGARYEGSLLVTPESVRSWQPRSLEEMLDAPDLCLSEGFAAEVTLLGCGDNPGGLGTELLLRLRKRPVAGCVFEVMDTGAACRTYNVLMTEGRDVSAALIAVA